MLTELSGKQINFKPLPPLVTEAAELANNAK